MIEVSNLTKKYGSNYAVKDLNFKIEKGQVYGFLGPNGAGKSTTMNILTGYIAATEGSVVINGHDILKEPNEARSCMGYLPEQPPLYQEMTVREYLNFAAELKGLKGEEKKRSIKEAAEQLYLGPVEGRLIRNLSKGYKQRVGFAQALLGSPEIIILDEPTVGLDPKQIIEIRSLIRELGQKHTVILSSHILSEVSEVCDHIMIISKGELVASSSTEDLLKQMQPVTILDITAVADDTAVIAALGGFDGITESSITETGEEGVLSVKIQYDSGEDLRMDIAKAFTEKGCTIIEMKAEKASLEEIFLELTADESNSGPQVHEDDDRILSESVDDLLAESGYAERPSEEGYETYGPGDAEADAQSDFADELAGGRDNVSDRWAYEMPDMPDDTEDPEPLSELKDGTGASDGSDSDEEREEE